MNVELDSLIAHLGRDARNALEGSSGKCVARGGYEITIEDFLLELLEIQDSEFVKILKQFELSVNKVNRAIQLSQDRRTGNTSHPVFSPLLIDWLQESWLMCSLKLQISHISSSAMILTLLANPNRFGRMAYFNYLEKISVEKLFDLLKGQICDDSNEISGISAEGSYNPAEGIYNPAEGIYNPAEGSKSNLNKYTVDFTALAKNGDIDPVFCRDNEIHQIIDVLARRRKNNPIAVGEPGVGKTAVVEGLALKIVQGDVPDLLKNVRLLGLDMGLLQAGASVKGEFEKRLKGVIDEVKRSEQTIILFIDEAHTLVGAGGQSGGNDAANLLKPALARGELRTIAATTWSEYKKYFEKDPALARRFQLVKLDEPSAEQAIVILRGLKDKYEATHGVYIRDEAIEAAAKLSDRYISGRLLPDKAIDVLDTACARVKISISSQPQILDDHQSQMVSLERELTAIHRDIEMGLVIDTNSVERITSDLSELSERYERLKQQWQNESKLASEILKIRTLLGKKTSEVPDDYNSITRINDEETGKEIVDVENETRESLLLKLETLKVELDDVINSIEIDGKLSVRETGGQGPLVSYEVDAALICEVIANWTGIPTGNMQSNAQDHILDFKTKMKQRIKGQNDAIDILDNAVKTAQAGLTNPDTPNGVFLLVGPSGVGKTETGIALADLLYGGERFMTTINMSEFQEKHSVSRLIGSPPGYVGYGEGGLLTEAIRQRPYSVVLLDEVEKADPEVMNLFYQVFDKGVLNDGEGREIDFKNTTILLTSNLASEVITGLCDQDERPDYQQLIIAIRETLSQYFKPALLARMTIVPYYPVHGQVMVELTQLKLDRVASRLQQEHKIQLEYGNDVLNQISRRCLEVEVGARNIDHIINNNIIPQISTRLLHNLSMEKNFASLTIQVNEEGLFDYLFA